MDFIINLLTSLYDEFVLNYNTNKMHMSILVLHGMLKTIEFNMAKSKPYNIATPNGSAIGNSQTILRVRLILRYLDLGILMRYFVSTTRKLDMVGLAIKKK